MKNDYLLMTAGPTMVRENVMQARSKFFTNPDLDESFFYFYSELCQKTQQILKAEKSSVIYMSGEGMVALDAACATLTEPGDEVLVIGNGIFGEGFTGLITPYGGKVTEFKSSWKKPVDSEELDKFIENSGKKFKYATLVHCDTPSGMLNDIQSICSVLKKWDIVSVVDTVASMGGANVEVDNWGIDIALGASQKAFSVPPGISLLTVSENAWKVMKNRKTPVASFYCNILLWENAVENRYFPYTMPVSDLYAMDVALNNILEEGIEETIRKHEVCAEYTRENFKRLGLENYLEYGFSPTVSAFVVPDGYCADEIMRHMKDNYSVLIAGSYGDLKGKVLRIGHMGENIRNSRVEYTINSLENTLKDLKKHG